MGGTSEDTVVDPHNGILLSLNKGENSDVEKT
jgi:hypothetical protein